MQLVLTALGILINIFLAIPSHNKALTDQKKPMLGKTLVSFVNLIDIAIEKGENIVDTIDQLFKYDAVCAGKNDLCRLINEQLVILHELSCQVQIKMCWEGETFGFDDIEIFKPTDVSKVLSIYEPGVLSSLSAVISHKFEILSQTMMILSEDILNSLPEKFLIREIEPVADTTEIFLAVYPLKSTRSSLMDHFQKLVDGGFITVTYYDMANSTERTEYILKIKTGLNDLKAGRESVAEFIRQNFEPHHLI